MCRIGQIEEWLVKQTRVYVRRRGKTELNGRPGFSLPLLGLKPGWGITHLIIAALPSRKTEAQEHGWDDGWEI